MATPTSQLLLEQYTQPVQQNGGLRTALPVYIDSDLTVTGTTNIAGISLTDLTVTGNTTIGNSGTDTLDVTGISTFIGTVTVGVDDAGHDVQFFGATTGKSLLWDESADKLIVTGDAAVTGATTLTGATQQTGAFTVGVNDTGHDVTFYGATSGKSLLWDESADKLIVTGDFAVTGTTTLTGATQQTGALTVGVDDTGHDVKFFGATTGVYLLWDESADQLQLVGNATGIALNNAGGASLKSGTAVPATAGAVAAGPAATLFSSGPSIYVTSDAPTHTAVKGSLCINTGGSSGSTRMYVNTDGGTTWTSFTTAA